jgi:hypothetical protein
MVCTIDGHWRPAARIRLILADILLSTKARFPSAFRNGEAGSGGPAAPEQMPVWPWRTAPVSDIQNAHDRTSMIPTRRAALAQSGSRFSDKVTLEYRN